MEQPINSTFDELKKILAEAILDKNPDDIGLDSGLSTELGIDSLAGIELAQALEEKFKISIDDQDLKSIVTVGDLLNYIEIQIRNGKTATKASGKNDFEQTLRVDKSLAEKLEFNPYYHSVTSSLGRRIIIEGREFISLGSNDYLGLASNTALKDEATRIIREYGMSMCATPITLGQTKFNRDLELKIASFLKQDDSIVYPSGYQANLAIMQLLGRETDIIIADQNIHSSLINSCRLSKAKLRFFAHNNIPGLKEILKASAGYRMRFILLEGIYSTDGDTACLDKIIELSKTYESFIIIDDAHGIGVLGNEGRGILEKYSAYADVGLVSGSLGKALGLFGGFISGKASTIDYFRYSSAMYFYSTALPAHIAAAGIVAFDFVKNNPQLRQRIWAYKETLYSALINLGYRLSKSDTPLFSILFQDNYSTVKMSRSLFSRGIYAVPFLPPSVPEGSPRIRLLPSASLEEEDIQKVISVFKGLAKEYASE